MDTVRSIIYGVLLLLCIHQELHLSAIIVYGQFLTTTCPEVSPASCPGAPQEGYYCIGQQCSQSATAQQAFSKPLSEATGTSTVVLPVEALKAISQPLAATQHAVNAQRLLAGQHQSNALLPFLPVPQRVQRYEYADNPVETPQQQQKVITQLKSIYNSPCANLNDACSTSHSNINNTVEVKAASVAPYSGPDSQVERVLTYLSNTKLKIGLDMDRAGAISWLSSPMGPAPWRNKNLINGWDQGRLLQQSYYGCVDGSCWATNPWLYNPVQGGNWENKPGRTARKVITQDRLYVAGYGRNWGNGNLVRELLLTSTVTLKDNYAVVKFSAKYTGNVTHPYMTQEVPAVFIDRRFSVLAYYDGAKPWSNDADITYAFPAGRNMYARPTEFWAAWIDPVTGWGVGVFSPVAWMGITAYRIGEDSSDKPWDCSYLAHTIRMQLHPGMGTYSYTVYVTIGKLNTIRATFKKLQRAPGVSP